MSTGHCTPGAFIADERAGLPAAMCQGEPEAVFREGGEAVATGEQLRVSSFTSSATNILAG